MNRVPRKPSAFTLLEIMIVVAIVLVILAVMTPGLMRAQAAAQRSGCLVNLRQMGAAFHGFLGENNYRIFPRGEQGGSSNYIAYLFPYADERKLYRCPATRGAPNYTERSYKINKTIAPGKGWLYDRSYFDIKSPSETIFVFDRGDRGKRRLFVRDTVEWEYADDVAITPTVISNYPFNHAAANDGQNLLFLDGSARFQTYPFTNDWYYPR